MENLIVCKVCDRPFVFSEYKPTSPPPFLKEAMLNAYKSLNKNVKSLRWEERTATCECGSHPETRISQDD